MNQIWGLPCSLGSHMKSRGKKPTHFGVYIFNASELNFNPIFERKNE
jgi:hypothetical protein